MEDNRIGSREHKQVMGRKMKSAVGNKDKFMKKEMNREAGD